MIIVNFGGNLTFIGVCFFEKTCLENKRSSLILCSWYLKLEFNIVIVNAFGSCCGIGRRGVTVDRRSGSCTTIDQVGTQFLFMLIASLPDFVSVVWQLALNWRVPFYIYFRESRKNNWCIEVVSLFNFFSLSYFLSQS